MEADRCVSPVRLLIEFKETLSCCILISSAGTFACNAVIVIALGIAWDLVKQKEPPQTGFFCHDATLTKPYVPARVRKLNQ